MRVDIRSSRGRIPTSYLSRAQMRGNLWGKGSAVIGKVKGFIVGGGWMGSIKHTSKGILLFPSTLVYRSIDLQSIKMGTSQDATCLSVELKLSLLT